MEYMMYQKMEKQLQDMAKKTQKVNIDYWNLEIEILFLIVQIGRFCIIHFMPIQKKWMFH